MSAPAYRPNDRCDQPFAGCRLDAVLSQGGLATTYKAHHLTLDLPVVVKVLEPAKVWGNPQAAARFLQEGRVLARLNHNNVVRVLSAGKDGDAAYLTLELAVGGSLREWLRGGGLSLETSLDWIAQAAEGLGAVHAQGLVHRDLKPDNLLVTIDGDQLDPAHDEPPEEARIKLVDFGLALEAGGDADQATVHGTPAYMAPEQVMGRPVDARSDVYALGVTLYECLVDRWPFNAPDPASLMRKHRDLQPPVEPLQEHEVPEQVIAFVLRCLSKKPSDRPADGAAFAAELRALAVDAGPARRGPRRRRGRRRRRKLSTSSARHPAARSGARAAPIKRGSSARNKAKRASTRDSGPASSSKHPAAKSGTTVPRRSAVAGAHRDPGNSPLVLAVVGGLFLLAGFLILLFVL